jgi:hypothetical protein
MPMYTYYCTSSSTPHFVYLFPSNITPLSRPGAHESYPPENGLERFAKTASACLIDSYLRFGQALAKCQGSPQVKQQREGSPVAETNIPPPSALRPLLPLRPRACEPPLRPAPADADAGACLLLPRPRRPLGVALSSSSSHLRRVVRAKRVRHNSCKLIRRLPSCHGKQRLLARNNKSFFS